MRSSDNAASYVDATASGDMQVGPAISSRTVSSAYILPTGVKMSWGTCGSRSAFGIRLLTVSMISATRTAACLSVKPTGANSTSLPIFTLGQRSTGAEGMTMGCEKSLGPDFTGHLD